MPTLPLNVLVNHHLTLDRIIKKKGPQHAHIRRGVELGMSLGVILGHVNDVPTIQQRER